MSEEEVIHAPHYRKHRASAQSEDARLIAASDRPYLWTNTRGCEESLDLIHASHARQAAIGTTHSGPAWPKECITGVRGIDGHDIDSAADHV
jgi:hypothetical protein